MKLARLYPGLTLSVTLITLCWLPVLANEISDYRVVNSSISEPLGRERGDPKRGRAVAVNSSQGNCIICHHIPINEVPAAAFGDLGPSLAGAGGRLSEAELRLRIVDSKAVNPETIMPAYHRVTDLKRVHPTYRGKPILSAQEVEDLVAFLVTLKEPAQ